MSLLTFLLMLVVGAVIVWGVMKAFNGQWRELIFGVVVLVVLFVALWILGALGVVLPTLPVIR